MENRPKYDFINQYPFFLGDVQVYLDHILTSAWLLALWLFLNYFLKYPNQWQSQNLFIFQKQIFLFLYGYFKIQKFSHNILLYPPSIKKMTELHYFFKTKKFRNAQPPLFSQCLNFLKYFFLREPLTKNMWNLA